MNNKNLMFYKKNIITFVNSFKLIRSGFHWIIIWMLLLPKALINQLKIELQNYYNLSFAW